MTYPMSVKSNNSFVVQSKCLSCGCGGAAMFADSIVWASMIPIHVFFAYFMEAEQFLTSVSVAPIKTGTLRST